MPRERGICSTTGYDSGWTAETRGLLKGLGVDAGDMVELFARMEPAMLVTVGDDVQSDALSYSRDVAQQHPGGGVEVHTDAIDAALDGGFE